MEKRKWQVTWITPETSHTRIIEADEMTFTPAGGVILGNKQNLVDIKAKDEIPITVVAHIQGYTSLIEVTSLVEETK